ncbi:hypothetical protein AO382_1618 [Moraxella catarrhalis]|uniref:Uncharacterized protein n=1 Tax=Moraxella catarrhalis TaxID=480 RepID=A0A7Z1A3H7_MORCA|nr:hypothetical protein AO382_1618 [Moraxella catarrhalis]
MCVIIKLVKTQSQRQHNPIRQAHKPKHPKAMIDKVNDKS